jgi:peroxiredoxin
MRLPVCCSLLLICAVVDGGEFNPTLSVGDSAPAWADLPGVDGETHSLADLPADDLVLVIFTCNSCPIARDYEERIIEFTKRHADDVQVVAINVNLIADDNLEAMQARSTERGFNFAYLFDETQQIAKDYGANGTPEFFLLSKATATEPAAGGSDTAAAARTLVYQGAMDDNADLAQVTKHHLEDAVTAALAGQPAPTKETYAHGCRIRFKRERRTESAN